MKQEDKRRIGEYIKKLRTEKGLSGRELAKLAGVDNVTIVRLEQGTNRAPRPDTLKAIAEALEVPLTDMFATAGYVIPYDLPALTPYLQARYGKLPDEAITEASAYLAQLIDKHGLDPIGPIAFEDESPPPGQ